MNRLILLFVAFLFSACGSGSQGTRLGVGLDEPVFPLRGSQTPAVTAWALDRPEFIVSTTLSKTVAQTELRRLAPNFRESAPNPDRVALFGSGIVSSASALRNPREIADFFVREYGSAFGSQNLVLRFQQVRSARGGDRKIFTYEQWMEGVPVEFSKLIVQLNRSPEGWSLNFASGILAPYPLAGFASTLVNEQAALQVVLNSELHQDFGNFGLAKKVVFYRFDEADRSVARIAWKIQGRATSRLVSFYVDAHAGSLLEAREEGLDYNSSGRITGFSTPGVLPNTSSNPSVEVPLANLLVFNSLSTTVATDSAGDYNLTQAGILPYTLTAILRTPYDTGAYFMNVFDDLGSSDVTKTASVAATSTNDFTFNSPITANETAQVNAYVNTQKAYRYFQDRATISELDTQSLQAIVNTSSLTCNAQYTPDADNTDPGLLVFATSSANCNDSAFSTVIAHEYGHHVVNRLGLIQQSFGEGFSDTLSMLLFDTPGVGFDFQKNNEYLRKPQIYSFQYPCDASSIYTCGMMLAGFFWEIRERIGLASTQQLHVDWSIITAGGATPSGVTTQNALHPTTIVEVLTADDDDSDLENGTPHQADICAAAEKFGLLCPVLLNFNFGIDLPRVIPPGEQVAVNITIASGLGSPQDDTAFLHYRIDGGEWVVVALTSTGVNTYTINFPILRDGQILEYYFSAGATSGATAYQGSTSYYRASGVYPANADVRVRLPKQISNLVEASSQSGTATGKIFAFGDGVASLTRTTMANREYVITKLPEGVVTGSRSLFYYAQEAVSSSFVFTNDSRTKIYYGSNVSGNIAIDPKFCGVFANVTQMVLTETAAGVPGRLVVYDEGVSRLYSFAINTSDDDLCTSEVSIPLPSVKWIRSAPAVGPQSVYVGYQYADELWVQLLNASNLGLLHPGQKVSGTRGSSFGDPAGGLGISVSGYMAVPIRFANDAVRGSDYLWLFDSSFTSTSVRTCRAPDRVRIDSVGTAYVLCKTARVVDRYNLSTGALIARYPLGTRPNDFYLYSPDGTSQVIVAPQLDARVVLIRTSYAAPNTFTTQTVNSTIPIDSMAGWDASSDAIYLNRSTQRIYAINLTTGVIATGSPFFVPGQVTDMVAQSPSTLHFASVNANRAYTLDRTNAENWRLIQYIVGTSPIRIGYRTNRLYVLNRASNNLSIVNLTVGALTAVTNVATQNQPVSFDFNTSVDQLWVANSRSNSITTINIASGGSEGTVIAHTALGFSPNFVEYVHDATAGNRSIYSVGTTNGRVLNQSDRATVRNLTFSRRVSSVFETSSAIAAISVDGFAQHLINRTTTTSTNLAYSPNFSVYDATNDRVIFGMANDSRVGRQDGLSFPVAPFNRMFQTSTHFAWYNYQSRQLKLSPFSLFSTGTPVALNTFSLELAIQPDLGAAVGANLWLAESGPLSFQLIDSNLEPFRILNKNRNRPVDLVASNTSIYVALKNNSAIYEYNPATGAYYWYSACEGPEKLLYDSSIPNLFIMCPEGNVVQALNATAGTITSNVTQAAGIHPVDMVLDSTPRLVVAARDSNQVLVFDSGLSPSMSVDLSSSPANVIADSSGIYVSAPNSREIQFLDIGFSLGTPIVAGGLGVKQVARTSTRLFGISSTPSFVYTNAENYARSGSSLISRQPPGKMTSLTNSAIISYPEADAVRFYDVATRLYYEIAVGDSPREIYTVATTNRAYIANYDSDSITVLNTLTRAIVGTVSLTRGCGPTKMVDLVIAGNRSLYISCDKMDQLEALDVQADANTLSLPISLRIRD